MICVYLEFNNSTSTAFQVPPEITEKQVLPANRAQPEMMEIPVQPVPKVTLGQPEVEETPEIRVVTELPEKPEIGVVPEGMEQQVAKDLPVISEEMVLQEGMELLGNKDPRVEWVKPDPQVAKEKLEEKEDKVNACARNKVHS